MRVAFALLLLAVCFVVLNDAHRQQAQRNPARRVGAAGFPRRHDIHGRGRGLAARARMGMRHQNRGRGNVPRPSRGRGRIPPALAGTIGRNNEGRKAWKVIKCGRTCAGQCENFETCQQTCAGNCTDMRFPRICKLNCLMNECLNSECSSCQRTCISGRDDCSREHCSQECPARLKWKAKRRPRCKRCLAEHCPPDEDDIAPEVPGDDAGDDLEPDRGLEEEDEAEVGVAITNDGDEEDLDAEESKLIQAMLDLV